jgi:predicted nucleic acid-binding protein
VSIAFVDTNIILRYLIGDDLEKMRACYALFKAADNNELTLTTSESVIAEAVFVLSSKKHYGFPAEEIKKRLMPILAIRGLRLEHQPTLKRALDLFAELEIDFEDCLCIAHIERQQLQEIYSYDQDFDCAANVKRIEPQGQHRL